MPLCSDFNFACATLEVVRLRKWRYRTSAVRTARRAMDRMNSSPRLQLIERPNRPHDRQAAFPKACLMGEKSGFAKAEVFEKE